MTNKVKVRYYCGNYDYSGGGGFAPSDVVVPDCGQIGIIEVTEDEWLEGFVSVECPKCGNVLTQADDGFEKVE